MILDGGVVSHPLAQPEGREVRRGGGDEEGGGADEDEGAEGADEDEGAASHGELPLLVVEMHVLVKEQGQGVSV